MALVERYLSPSLTAGIVGLPQEVLFKRAKEGTFPQPVEKKDSTDASLVWKESEVISWLVEKSKSHKEVVKDDIRELLERILILLKEL